VSTAAEVASCCAALKCLWARLSVCGAALVDVHSQNGSPVMLLHAVLASVRVLHACAMLVIAWA
jgi:hypothetical protein